MLKQMSGYGDYLLLNPAIGSYQNFVTGKMYFEMNKHNVVLVTQPFVKLNDGTWGFNTGLLNPPDSYPGKIADPETPRKDPNWPTSDGKRAKPKPSTITGLWIITRLSLYFAGFEAGTGDPIFVRFLFGLTSAHLYLTQVQADQDAGRVRKFYKRPDIPVNVVQI
jgi:hypothetical protein